MKIVKALVVILLCVGVSLSVAPAAAQEKDEGGAAVTHALTIEKCSSCHKKDEKGRLTRISWERRTPEGWQQAIKRMVRLNGLSLTPEEARGIVKYLSNQHGLAPEEARPAMYYAEHRLPEETVPDESTRNACTICHTYGRILSQRRSREEWSLLVNMHVGYFPVVEFQGFRRFPPPPGVTLPPGTDTRHPADRAVEYLAKTFPLQTPEWDAWRANMRAPRIAGRWLAVGTQAGRGRIYGEVVIEPTAVEDEFTTKTTLTYVDEKKTVTRTGRSIVYAGYSWRGRSLGPKPAGEVATTTDPAEMREVMFVSRDWSQIDGRWFWGEYEEFGIDIALRRIDEAPIVAGLDRAAIQTPAENLALTIHGANLPANPTPADIDLGPGITVRRIVSASPAAIAVQVDVAAGAALGKRDISVRRFFAPGAVTVYDKIDYIKVAPDSALARLGGVRFPKGYAQFEAIAWNRGPDNKPQTADDLNLGPIEADWSIEEFPSTFDDDDKNFIGSLSRTGLFTPAVEGPNPQRKFERNNYGEVWIVATRKGDKPLVARSYFVVTVPLYAKWDQPEVAPK